MAKPTPTARAEEGRDRRPSAACPHPRSGPTPRDAALVAPRTRRRGRGATTAGSRSAATAWGPRWPARRAGASGPSPADARRTREPSLPRPGHDTLRTRAPRQTAGDPAPAALASGARTLAAPQGPKPLRTIARGPGNASGAQSPWSKCVWGGGWKCPRAQSGWGRCWGGLEAPQGPKALRARVWGGWKHLGGPKTLGQAPVEGLEALEEPKALGTSVGGAVGNVCGAWSCRGRCWGGREQGRDLKPLGQARGGGGWEHWESLKPLGRVGGWKCVRGADCRGRCWGGLGAREAPKALGTSAGWRGRAVPCRPGRPRRRARRCR